MTDVLDRLRGGLVVSCQPVDNGPMDDPRIVAAMATAAVSAGAVGLRIEGLANLRATRAVTKAPIIGLLKRDLPDSPVRITPFADDILALVDAGADIVAIDATNRQRPEPVADLLATIRKAGRPAMADCATEIDGREARALGADILGTTLSGYTDETAATAGEVDLALVASFRRFGGFVMAEGRIHSPELAAAAMAAGADAVTVGTALTRLEVTTGWFRDAIARERG